ncbi:MAG TPA: glycosyltransferase family 4 protein [Candidatus Hydrogenedentes bacterium]|nr:glycosyltransferase family 4 protein [Candidatus Hydrogenedentota bacterium]HQL93601.1 glycosyltransferase family 4 protein [Candidatus Hydrogenedentota bacterium]
MNPAHDTDTPPRVLLLAESPYFGGITTHLLALHAALEARWPGVSVLASLSGRREDRSLFEQAAARGLEALEIPMSGPWDPRVLPRLRALTRTRRVSVVHTHNYRASLLAATALPHLPLVVTCHGIAAGPARVRGWQALERGVAMRRARRVVACADAVRDALLARGVAPGKLRVARNAAPAPRAVGAEELAALRARHGLEECGLTALYAGRLVEGKGLETLLDALPRARGWAAVLLGDGPLRPALEAHARRLKVPTVFPGHCGDTAPWYALADAVVLPSLGEALPMTLVEAAAAGKPAVASQVGGVPEVLQDGVTGFLTPPGDPEALAAALRRLEDPGIRVRMGVAARERWHGHFTPEILAAALAAVYREASE